MSTRIWAWWSTFHIRIMYKALSFSIILCCVFYNEVICLITKELGLTILVPLQLLESSGSTLSVLHIFYSIHIFIHIFILCKMLSW